MNICLKVENAYASNDKCLCLHSVQISFYSIMPKKLLSMKQTTVEIHYPENLINVEYNGDLILLFNQS